MTIEAAEPVTARNSAPLEARRMPLILQVPAAVIVSVPLIVGVLSVPPVHAEILTPAVRVTFSVTESRKKIVSPETASAIAPTNVVWVPFAAEVATIRCAGP